MARVTHSAPRIRRNRLHQNLARVAVVGICVGISTGCVRDTSDLRAYISEVKARPTAPIEPIPEMKPFESFTYPADNLRDPFAPLAFSSPQEVAATGTGPNPDKSRPRELLEEFPLDTLRMMGTLQQQGSLWALVKDPSGTIHRVQTGNFLGQNYGRIIGIDEQQVKLVEIVSNSTGGWIERDAALAIKE